MRIHLQHLRTRVNRNPVNSRFGQALGFRRERQRQRTFREEALYCDFVVSDLYASPRRQRAGPNLLLLLLLVILRLWGCSRRRVAIHHLRRMRWRR